MVASEISSVEPTTYTARWIVPVEGAPLDGGSLTVRDGRITAVAAHGSKLSNAARTTIDLGDVAILPGFINAHTHLEFGDLRRPLGHAGMPFPDWIREVLAYRRSGSFEPAAATAEGLHESARFGVTTIGDIASSCPTEMFDRPPTEASVTSFVELLGLGEERLADQRDRLDAFLAREDAEFVRRGVSPHAPYSTRLALVEAAALRSAEHGVPAAMHLAESREELQLLCDGTGPFAELLRGFGVWDPKAIPASTTPLDYLRILSRAHRALVVHGNYLAPQEIDFLAAHAERMTTIYCPRTHAYFAHDEHPLPKLLAAGAAVALGTDGRCTNPDLDLLAEMCTVVDTFPQLSSARILQLGTLDGARALGLEREVGSLAVGKQADFVAVRVADLKSEPTAGVLSGDARVVRVWKRGREAAID